MTSIKLYTVKKILNNTVQTSWVTFIFCFQARWCWEILLQSFPKVFQSFSLGTGCFFHSFSVQSLHLTTFRGRLFCLFGHIYGWLKHRRHQTRGMKQCCVHKTIRSVSIEKTNRQPSKEPVLVTIHLTAIDKARWRLSHCLGLPFSQCSRSHSLAFLEPEL